MSFDPSAPFATVQTAKGKAYLFQDGQYYRLVSFEPVTPDLSADRPLVVGVPAGGDDGQVLKKASAEDHDLVWGDSSAGAATWGAIGGTLSNQSDLATALGGKSDTTHHHDADYAAIVHTHPAVDISDSTALGRSLVTAADAAAGRSALVLGDSSTLDVGTGAGTVAAGNHSHTGVYATASHGHAIADVSGLQTALDGKQAAGSYAASSHSHSGLAPAGGSSGQVLKKNSATDYDYSWGTDNTGAGGSVAWADITGKPTYLYHMEVPWHSDNSANATLTNQANSEQALQNQQARARKKLDLSNMTQARLIAQVVTASASVNSPRLYLTYATTYAGARNGLASGSNPTVSLASATTVDTGWFDIAAGARVDNIWIEVTQNGGDGAADPALGYCHVLFRG